MSIAFIALAALIAGISLTIFDPVRTISIKAHITRAFHFEDNFVFRWFQQRGEDLINKVRSLGRDDLPNDGGNATEGKAQTFLAVDLSHSHLLLSIASTVVA